MFHPHLIHNPNVLDLYRKYQLSSLNILQENLRETLIYEIYSTSANPKKVKITWPRSHMALIFKFENFSRFNYFLQGKFISFDQLTSKWI